MFGQSRGERLAGWLVAPEDTAQPQRRPGRMRMNLSVLGRYAELSSRRMRVRDNHRGAILVRARRLEKPEEDP